MEFSKLYHVNLLLLLMCINTVNIQFVASSSVYRNLNLKNNLRRGERETDLNEATFKDCTSKVLAKAHDVYCPNTDLDAVCKLFRTIYFNLCQSVPDLVDRTLSDSVHYKLCSENKEHFINNGEGYISYFFENVNATTEYHNQCLHITCDDMTVQNDKIRYKTCYIFGLLSVGYQIQSRKSNNGINGNYEKKDIPSSDSKLKATKAPEITMKNLGSESIGNKDETIMLNGSKPSDKSALKEITITVSENKVSNDTTTTANVENKDEVKMKATQASPVVTTAVKERGNKTTSGGKMEKVQNTTIMNNTGDQLFKPDITKKTDSQQITNKTVNDMIETSSTNKNTGSKPVDVVNETKNGSSEIGLVVEVTTTKSDKDVKKLEETSSRKAEDIKPTTIKPTAKQNIVEIIKGTSKADSNINIDDVIVPVTTVKIKTDSTKTENDRLKPDTTVEKTPNQVDDKKEMKLDKDSPPSSGSFMAYLITAVVLCIAGYVLFHNKHKIIAFIVEGRSGQSRRKGGVQYKKLKSNVEEVMPSLDTTTSSKNFIY